jgi:selenide,water dikinase
VELGQVLGALPPIVDPNVLNASAARDDAAVYRIAPKRALVATLDFFTPIVDDPYAYGGIAVGGKPLFALGITAFPRAKLSSGLLEKIVAGGAAKMGEAGVAVVGGHSVDDDEPKFGYSVIGEVNPERAIGHQGASAGDVLFLTKPLGTGLVTTAIKRGLCPPDVEAEAIAVMTMLNREASEQMVKARATAATDVTGYGLIGHIANLSGGADLDFDSIPFIKGVGNLAERGLFPDGSRRNHAAYRDRVAWGGLGETEQMMLTDAQTSGGLLVAISPEKAGRFKGGVRIGVMRSDGAIRIHR